MGALGRVVWTVVAFWFVVTLWGVTTRALLDERQAWAYLLFSLTTVVLVAIVAGLRAVWRDARYW
jgi:hypothetical protein